MVVTQPLHNRYTTVTGGADLGGRPRRRTTPIAPRQGPLTRRSHLKHHVQQQAAQPLHPLLDAERLQQQHDRVPAARGKQQVGFG